MKSFKDDMAGDLDDTFMDIEEFADLHEVNGREIPIMFDDERLEKIRKFRGDIRDDVFQGEVFFFALERDLGCSLQVNELITLDGKEKFVHSAELKEGLWSIVLGRRQL